MTLATEAFEKYLDFLESHCIEVKLDESARAILRAMHDQIEGRKKIPNKQKET